MSVNPLKTLQITTHKMNTEEPSSKEHTLL